MSTRGKGPQEKLEPLIARRGSKPQGVLEKDVGLSRGTLTQIENGTMLPPDRPTCDAIDRALGLEPGTVWNECAPYRLRRFDPDLAEWHQEQVDAARGGSLSPDEKHLLQVVRQIAAHRDAQVPAGRAVARMLADALAALLVEPTYTYSLKLGGKPVQIEDEPIRNLGESLRDLSNLPAVTQQKLWLHFNNSIATVEKS